MHSHRHLFEKIATLENLIAAAHAALRGKRMRMPGAAFLADFEKEVVLLHEELWAGNRNNNNPTNENNNIGFRVASPWNVCRPQGPELARFSSRGI